MNVTVILKRYLVPRLRWHVFGLPALLIVVLFSSGCATKTLSVPKTASTSDVPALGTNKPYNQPYTVRGQRYYPLASATGYVEYGIASWYGWESGNRTAMGLSFDPRRLTAAHRTLPLPTKVHVTNLENKRSVVVVVNDRGPFIKSRLIDLSQGAARKIGLTETGTARVKVVAIDSHSSAP